MGTSRPVASLRTLKESVAVHPVLRQAAVEVVRPRLGRGDELSGRGVSELRAELVRQQGELLDRVRDDGGDGTREVGRVVVEAVDDEIIVAGAIAADRSA